MNDLLELSPVILVTITGLAILVMDLFRESWKGGVVRGGIHLAWLMVLGLAAAMFAVVKLWPGGSGGFSSPLLAGSLIIDAYTLFFWGLLIVTTMAAVLASGGFDLENNLDHGEYYSFFAFSLCGMMLMVAASDLLILFLALETFSLSIYVLVAMKRDSARAAEAALKYFLNGGLASGLILYGLALIWGESGTFSIAGLGEFISDGAGSLVLMGCTLVLVGFGFKVAVFPLHMWTPDAYQGAPAPVSGFMAAAVKGTAFAALFRLVFTAMVPELFRVTTFSFVDVVIAVSVATMVVGNLIALHQDDVKRMLAYSSISHAGYVLMGLVLVPTLGSGAPSLTSPNSSVLFYLAAYAFSTLLAFGVVARLGRGSSEDATLVRLQGVAGRSPLLAALLALALLSLAGFPPTAGFFAKFSLFRDVIKVSHGKLVVLVVIAVVNTLISVYYYIRPIVYMYMKEGKGEEREISSPSSSFALILLALVVLGLGILPGKFVSLSDQAARTVTYQNVASPVSSASAPGPFVERTSNH